MQRPQRGFTLVEIAIVLVVIGLLLGGVLKGQELIASARVRSMADQQAGIQSAFYGFQDRFRAVPGDMPEGDADEAIQATVTTGGDGNGQIDDGGNSIWEEANAVWEHMSKAGFLKGSYDGDDTNASDADTAPTNSFGGVLVLAWDDGYTGNNPARLILHMGRNVPVSVARELDVKLDDGEPNTGILRNALTTGSPYSDNGVGHSADDCIDTSGDPIWDIATNNVQDCHPTYLF